MCAYFSVKLPVKDSSSTGEFLIRSQYVSTQILADLVEDNRLYFWGLPTRSHN